MSYPGTSDNPVKREDFVCGLQMVLNTIWELVESGSVKWSEYLSFIKVAWSGTDRFV